MQNELSRIDYIRELIADCRYDDAMEMLSIATEEEPDNIDYNYELARIFMELGNYPAAVSNLELVTEKIRNHLIYLHVLMILFQSLTRNNNKCNKSKCRSNR